MYARHLCLPRSWSSPHGLIRHVARLLCLPGLSNRPYPLALALSAYLLIIFLISISPMPRAPLDVRELSLIARQTLSTRMFHVKHSGHFLLLFEPIIFLTTYTDNFRGKLFHVKHRVKAAANGVRLYFLCRQFTLTMPRHYLFRRLSSYIARPPLT